jgi:large subunit ribosomal protein L29
MDFAEIKNKSVKDLKDLLVEKRNELLELRFRASEGQLKKVREILEVRKIIARILTLLTQK